MKTQMSTEKGNINPAFNEGDEPNIKYTVKKKELGLELKGKAEFSKGQNDYNPYLNREVEHPTTNFETFIHLLKGSLGTGILAMSNAFNDSGYVTGIIGTIIIGVLCTYCIHQLISAEYELCKRKKVASLNYVGVTEAALLEGPKCLHKFSKMSVYVVNLFLVVYQLGTCCVYVVFVASNIKRITDLYTDDATDVRLIMVFLLIPLIFLNWIKNLKFLAPFSTFANAITLISFGFILYFIFEKPFVIEDKQAFGKIQNFPLFFGTVLFALEAIGVILPLENEMKTPKAFASKFGVLNNAMVIIVVLYVGMGLFGYLRYGSDVMGSITLNLPTNDIKAQAVQGMLAFAIFISHGLACYVAIDIIWNEHLSKKVTKSKQFWEYVTRTLLVFFTFLLAIAIPNLELFISLFGALCLSALGLAFPALIQTCVYWNTTEGFSKAIMVTKNAIIFILATVGLISGTYTSIKEIVHTFF
ncbi:unnamed protein product [Chironomus riparius]|uniref:Amino acid transporter transmembrane domain-containing protein n=1 Tax=Chironomus riparius TaxID=315576 RepID=A0A9N9WS64_9DIPT|nr:unnamed protein product [Chironomus riparius]